MAVAPLAVMSIPSSILGLADYDRLPTITDDDPHADASLNEKPLSDPALVVAAPVEPAPVEPASVATTPVETAPVEPEPSTAVSVAELENPLDLFPSERSAANSS